MTGRAISHYQVLEKLGGPHREPAGSARPRPVPDTHHQAGYGYVLIQLFPMQAGTPSEVSANRQPG
jgi:hypothetical protein